MSMPATTLQCPQCGAALKVETAATVMIVCASCRSTITRDAEGARRVGVMAELVEDGSPVQLGTRGACGTRGFRVMGRLRLRYDGGEWNEWFVDFDTGGTGWLSDASAQYAVTEVAAWASAVAAVPAFESIRAGQVLRISDMDYTASDVRTAQCVGGEGELPMVVGEGWTAKVVDARRRDLFATLDYTDGAPVAYVGVAGAVAFDASTLRSREAVQAAAGAYRGDIMPLACPQCGGAISLVAALATQVACPYCGSLLDCSGPRAEILEAAHRAAKFKPTLALGAKGTLDGTSYTVIGAMRCRVPNDSSEPPWTEYLLFAAHAGYLWLVETQDGWQRVQVCDVWPDMNAGSCRWGSRGWYRGYVYDSRVEEVFGAFNWRVRRGDITHISEYANGADVLTREATDDEITWSLARPLADAVVRRAFGLPVPARANLGQIAKRADATDDGDLISPAVLATIAIFILSDVFTMPAMVIGLLLIWAPVALRHQLGD